MSGWSYWAAGLAAIIGVALPSEAREVEEAEAEGVEEVVPSLDMRSSM